MGSFSKLLSSLAISVLNQSGLYSGLYNVLRLMASPNSSMDLVRIAAILAVTCLGISVNAARMAFNLCSVRLARLSLC